MLRMLFPGTTVRDVFKRSSSALMVAAMVLSVATPLLLSGKANAATITERKITMSSSKRGQTNATYTVSFKPATTGNVDGVVVEFCANNPLIGTACTAPNVGNTLEGFTAATAAAAGWTLNGASDSNTVILTRTAAAMTSGVAETVTLTGITNPNPTTPAPASFYARILTYNTGAASYTDTAPGTHVDEGGIALSTASQLTVNAQVQEELEFCVGTVDNTVVDAATAVTFGANTCAGAAYTGTSPTVNLGVVSTSGVTISPVSTTTSGNNSNGAVLIRTNGANGASITYFAEQDSGSGRLKVPGAACTNAATTGDFDDSSTNTDQCFNSNATQSDFTVTALRQTEEFGMTSSAVIRPTGSTTTNLVRDTNYDGDGTAAGGFAWQSNGTTTTLASSSAGATVGDRVLDYEMLILNFAARAAATTPTGQYAVTSTYVATTTF